MIFRLHYDFIEFNKQILLKPCICENIIQIENDFTDKLLYIYLYVNGFYLLQLHKNLYIKEYSFIYIYFARFLIIYYKNDPNLNNSFLYNITNVFSTCDFFNDISNDNNFEKYVIPFLNNIIN